MRYIVLLLFAMLVDFASTAAFAQPAQICARRVKGRCERSAPTAS